MHGLENVTWSAKDFTKMEVVQNRVVRLTLGVNRYVATEATRGDAGWSSLVLRRGWKKLFRGIK